MIFQDLQNVLIPNETAKNLSSDFVADAAAGNLPNYASLDPFYGDFTSAIDPSVNVTKLQSDGCAGNIFGKSEELLKFVYDTLRASPQWNKTLLLVTFDEHGGINEILLCKKKIHLTCCFYFFKVFSIMSSLHSRPILTESADHQNILFGSTAWA